MGNSIYELIIEKLFKKETNMDKLSLQNPYSRRRQLPPWLDNVNLTPELIYKYQVTGKTVADVLQADLNFLKTVNQVC